jgi:hypothetical protein
MATTGKADEVGRNRQGNWRAGYLTHAELVSELGTASGERLAELVREAQNRMQRKSYPPFPAHLQEVLSDQSRNPERADAGTAQQPGDAGGGRVPVDSHG